MREAREDSNDPLVSFFTSSVPAGSLDQIVEEVLNGYLILGWDITRYYNENIINISF